MIHTSNFELSVYPFNGDIAPAQIDRLQDLTATPTSNREKIREVGRDGIVDWRQRIPSTTVTARQLEYGTLNFWRKVANVSDNETSIDLNDFKTSMIDIVGYKTNDSGTFLGSVWYPKLRTSGFGINIGDTQANIERNFSFIGEDEIVLQGDNKYFNYKRGTVSGSGVQTVTIENPTPVADPDNSGQYLFRVLRVIADGTTTELTYSSVQPTSGSDTYTYSAGTLTVYASAATDIYKVYYSAGAYMTGLTPFTNNDTDAATLVAENASIYLYVSANNYVYRLQSVAIDVSFDRSDYYEIGNKEVVQRGVNDKTVRVTLGRILEAYTVEEVLRGKAAGYGKLSIREYTDNTTLRVKLFGNSAKTSFNIGYKVTGLAPTSFDASVPLNAYSQRNVTLESDNLTISNSSATIDA
jgi:hypothetical protein